MKDNGTVEFEVPGDVEPQSFEVRSGTVYNEADDEPLDSTDLQYIPPLQIVILIVGTRGDVQPFIAIGKRLQVGSLLLLDNLSFTSFPLRNFSNSLIGNCLTCLASENQKNLYHCP